MKLIPSEEMEQQQDLLKFFAQIYDKTDEKVNEAILVIGDKGVGKTAVVSRILNYTLNNTDYFSLNKEIKIPEKYNFDKNVIWDCPSLTKTKNIVQKLVNLFFLKRLFENTNKFKFIIVASESSITEPSGGFSGSIKSFASLFKYEDLVSLSKSLMFVITKNTTKNQLTLPFNNIINENQEIKEFLKTLFYQCPTNIRDLGQLKAINVSVQLPHLAFIKDTKNLFDKLIIKVKFNIAEVNDVLTKIFQKESFNYDKTLGCEKLLMILPNQKLLTNTEIKYFSGLQQMLELYKISKNEVTNHSTMVSNYLSILLGKMHPVEYYFAQQLAYISFFSYSKNTPNKLCEPIVKHCYKIINDVFMPFIKDIQLKNNMNIDYYHTAIKWLDLYINAAEVSATQANAYYNIGRILHKDENLKEALGNYIKAIKCNDKLVSAYTKIGNIFYKSNKEQLAIKYYHIDDKHLKIVNCFKKLITKDPENPNIYIEKGNYLLEKEYYEDAIKSYLDAKNLLADNCSRQQEITNKIKQIKVGHKLGHVEHCISLNEIETDLAGFYNYYE